MNTVPQPSTSENSNSSHVLDDESSEEWSEDQEWEEEDDPDCSHLIRAKWVMDGAKTLTEAAEQLRGFAEHLETAAAAGWELNDPVEDDYGFLSVPAKIAALERQLLGPEGPSLQL